MNMTLEIQQSKKVAGMSQGENALSAMSLDRSQTSNGQNACYPRPMNAVA